MKNLTMKCLLLAMAIMTATPTIPIRVFASNEATTEYSIYKVLTASNLRATPSRDGRWVATIPKNALVILVDGSASEFCHVTYGEYDGYIYRGCISKVEGAAYEAAVEELGLTLEVEDVQNLEEQSSSESCANVLEMGVSLVNPENMVANVDVEQEAIVEQSMEVSNYISNTEIVYYQLAAPTVEIHEEPEVVYERASIVANAVLRRFPSVDSAKIQTINAKEEIQIIDEGSNGYLHVLYAGVEGYVFARAVSRTGNVSGNSGVLETIVTPETVATNSTAEVAYMTARHRSLSASVSAMLASPVEESDIAVETVELAAMGQVTNASTLQNNNVEYQIRARANMRSIPSKDGDKITTLPIGANVQVLGQKADGYTLVQYNGIVGYVLESVVVDSVDFASMTNSSALFTLTAYCTCAKCCGSYSPEVTGRQAHTATGTIPTEGRTIAVDPSVIPYGSVVHIEGLGDYIAEDCGGAVRGNHIDVYFESHESAVAFGRQRRYVTIN